MKTFIIIILILTCQAGYSQNADSLNIAPNPFNTSTYIYYGLANNDTVSLYLYKMNGQTVKTFMHDSLINSGYYSIYFPADSLADGVYFVMLELGTHKIIGKKAIKYNTSSVVENESLKYSTLFIRSTNSSLCSRPFKLKSV